MSWMHLLMFALGVLLGWGWAQDRALLAMERKKAFFIYGTRVRISPWSRNVDA